jgi:hypothetical protein
MSCFISSYCNIMNIEEEINHEIVSIDGFNPDDNTIIIKDAFVVVTNSYRTTPSKTLYADLLDKSQYVDEITEPFSGMVNKTKANLSNIYPNIKNLYYVPRQGGIAAAAFHNYDALGKEIDGIATDYLLIINTNCDTDLSTGTECSNFVLKIKPSDYINIKNKFDKDKFSIVYFYTNRRDTYDELPAWDTFSEEDQNEKVYIIKDSLKRINNFFKSMLLYKKLNTDIYGHVLTDRDELNKRIAEYNISSSGNTKGVSKIIIYLQYSLLAFITLAFLFRKKTVTKSIYFILSIGIMLYLYFSR